VTLLAPAGRPPAASSGHGHHPAGLDWHEARRVAWAVGTVLSATAAAELVGIGGASGRILAEDVRSLVALPGFDSAAMDGWALGPGDGPWRIGDAVPMGSAPDRRVLATGSARPVTTGGPVPSGTVSVLRSEDGESRDGLLHARRLPPPGAHIRRAGEESSDGEVLARGGAVLTPPRCALLAAGGHDAVRVRRRPRVATITFGDEVLHSGAPRPGRVRDVFGPSIPPIVTAFGAEAGPVRAVADHLDRTVEALEDALRRDSDDGAPGETRWSCSDVVITTGGTAHGSGDHLRAALHRIGARIVVDGVTVRPGHPVTLATLPDGRLLLGLPGNPLAGLLCLVALGGPLLAGALGRPLPALGVAVTAHALPNRTGSTRLVACVHADATGSAGVLPLGRQGSAMLRGLASAEVVAIVPPGGLDAGAPVETLPLPW
jgi:molybdopterin molybdotransferase